MFSPKTLYRVANRLHRAWSSRAAESDHTEHCTLDRLTQSYEGFQCAKKALAASRQNNLSLILPRMREDVLGQLRLLQGAIEGACRHLERPSAAPPSVSNLVVELRQLDAEFTGLDVDWKRSVLSVTTEPITLQHVELGPFAIELCWDRLNHQPDSNCFDIDALEPNPASADDLITHPHVKDLSLCAGDAAPAIRTALQEGRLADAFCLVRSVLLTYNARSPHALLAQWDGQECSDCTARTRT